MPSRTDDMDPDLEKPAAPGDRGETMAQIFDRFEQRIFAALARHFLAEREAISAAIRRLAEPYRDLPVRVTPRPARKRTRRS